MRRFFLIVVILLIPQLAHATSYNCETAQAVDWHNGKFRSDKSLPQLKDVVLNFNSETSVLGIGTHKHLLSPVSMQIIRDIDADNDLVAITPANGEGVLGYVYLRIRGWDKKNGLIFWLHVADTNSVFVGRCKISNDWPY